jgi:predicted membrane protein
MSNSGLTYFTQQMLYQTPTLLVALIGIVLSFVFMKRAKIPAFVALLGCATVIIGSLMVTIAQAYFFSASFSSLAITSNSYVQMAKIVSWIGAFIRGFSILLLIVAIFIGRKATPSGPQASSPAL